MFVSAAVRSVNINTFCDAQKSKYGKSLATSLRRHKISPLQTAKDRSPQGTAVFVVIIVVKGMRVKVRHQG